MSYILDALRRAEAERVSGQVPGLHAQSASSGKRDVHTRPLWSRPWVWVGCGVCGGVLLAALAVWLLTQPAPTPPPAVVVAPRAPVTEATPVPLTPTNPSVVPALAQRETPAYNAPPYNAPPIEPRSPITGAVRGVPAPAPVRQVAEPEPLPSRAESKVSAFTELAPELRSQLPALSIGGSSYSENPASRLLIVNGQVFREGDKLHPDLVLERIELKSAVLRFKDIRYRVSF